MNPILLEYAKDNTPKIYVGKRKGIHLYNQDQINEMIVENAAKYGNVIRLKGGDPFVFGRGYEEILFAEAANIPTEYIPGLSSSICLLGLQGIPVTHRGSSESFLVVTATTRTGKLSGDIEIAAQSTATIVILMGLTKLQEIADVFKAQGREDRPIAVIQKGSTPDEITVFGTMSTIVDIVKEKAIRPPAVIVIGDVVKLKMDKLIK